MSTLIQPIEERRLTGIVFVLIGYFTFTVIDSCAKWLTLSGLPTGEVVFVRYAGQLLLVLALFAPTEGRRLAETRRPWLEIIRGLCLLGSTAANFLALKFLPLTVTSSINFSMPLVLCALSIPLLGEHVGWRRWLAIAIGFIGVLIVVRPGTQAFHPASLLSVLNVFLVASYMLLNRKLAGVDSTATQQFYASLVATLCVAGFAVGSWVAERPNCLGLLHRHRRGGVRRALAHYHRPSPRAGIGARALWLCADHFHDGIELAGVQPAAG